MTMAQSTIIVHQLIPRKGNYQKETNPALR
jgi:hypothetical protein